MTQTAPPVPETSAIADDGFKYTLGTNKKGKPSIFVSDPNTGNQIDEVAYTDPATAELKFNELVGVKPEVHPAESINPPATGLAEINPNMGVLAEQDEYGV